MKAIPKKDLLQIVESFDRDVVFEDFISALFKKYGDDYFKDYGISPYELCNKNQLREEKIKEIKEQHEAKDPAE